SCLRAGSGRTGPTIYSGRRQRQLSRSVDGHGESRGKGQAVDAVRASDAADRGLVRGSAVLADWPRIGYQFRGDRDVEPEPLLSERPSAPRARLSHAAPGRHAARRLDLVSPARVRVGEAHRDVVLALQELGPERVADE